MIPKKLALGLDPRVGTGFPPEPVLGPACGRTRWAGEGRSDKIMRMQNDSACHRVTGGADLKVSVPVRTRPQAGLATSPRVESANGPLVLGKGQIASF